VNEDEWERVARSAVPNVRTYSVRQRQELRWRTRVLRFENGPRNVGLAEKPEFACEDESEDSNDEELSYAVLISFCLRHSATLVRSVHPVASSLVFYHLKTFHPARSP
jgi:hypothetical protein